MREVEALLDSTALLAFLFDEPGASAADLTGDGKIDVVVVNNFDPERVYTLVNDGTGRFTREATSRMPAVLKDAGGYFSVELADVNEDDPFLEDEDASAPPSVAPPPGCSWLARARASSALAAQKARRAVRSVAPAPPPAERPVVGSTPAPPPPQSAASNASARAASVGSAPTPCLSVTVPTSTLRG